jgi:hypothetical protein
MFDASNNYLEGDLSELRFSTNLVSLQLYKNNLTGQVPAELGEFKKLVNLSLYSNRLTGPLPQKLGSYPSVLSRRNLGYYPSFFVSSGSWAGELDEDHRRGASPLSGQARRRRPSFSSAHVVVVVHLFRRWVITQDRFVDCRLRAPVADAEIADEWEERGEWSRREKTIKYTYKVLQ